MTPINLVLLMPRITTARTWACTTIITLTMILTSSFSSSAISLHCLSFSCACPYFLVFNFDFFLHYLHKPGRFIDPSRKSLTISSSIGPSSTLWKQGLVFFPPVLYSQGLAKRLKFFYF